MKDYIELNNKYDLKRINAENDYIKGLQESESYPLYYSYPITLQFELTGDCNLNCAHCYNRSGDSDVVKGTKMGPEDWKRLAREVVNDGGIFQCILSGGEPLLLGKHLFDIMDILHDDGTSFIIITNGLLLTDRVVRQLSKYRFFWLQVSIDGATPEYHDKFRGVKGSWEKAVKGALEVSNQGIPLTIAHTVTPENLSDLEEMVELSCKLGAGTIILGEVLPSGRAITNENVILDYDQRNLMHEKIAALTKQYQDRVRIERSMSLSAAMQRYISTPNGGGIIRPNGDFRLDCMAPFVIGNVLEAPLKDIWIQKGINAWQDPRVTAFVASIDQREQKGSIQNHLMRDIRL